MPRIYVLSGDFIGATHDFESGAVLGRGKTADVVLGAPSVSREHARIELRDDEWIVIDLGSSNGLRVGGRRVSEAVLHDGSVLVLGDLELRFGLSEGGDSGRPQDRPAPSPARSVTETTFTPQPAVDLGTPGSSGDTGEIELEGEWSEVVPEVVPTRPAPPAAGAPAASQPATAAAQQRRPTRDREDARVQALGGGTAAGERRTTSGKRVLQYHKVENTGGLLGAELSQQPFFVRWGLYLLAAGLFAGLAWGAFQLTGAARQSADMVRDVDG